MKRGRGNSTLKLSNCENGTILNTPSRLTTSSIIAGVYDRLNNKHYYFKSNYCPRPHNHKKIKMRLLDGRYTYFITGNILGELRRREIEINLNELSSECTRFPVKSRFCISNLARIMNNYNLFSTRSNLQFDTLLSQHL